MKALLRVAAASALLVSGALFGEAAWMRAKAAVASVRIERALERTLRDGRPHPPWGWADFHPVARLRVPRLGVSTPVLSNASGAALAFGLGHVAGTAPPGSSGNVAIAGHRDTWAEFLRDVRVGDEVVLQSAAGVASYRVERARVVAAEAVDVLDDAGDDRLTLVTCWPFGGLVGSRQRIVLSGRASRALQPDEAHSDSSRPPVRSRTDSKIASGSMSRVSRSTSRTKAS